ncbi:MAG: hypothetical protein KAG28_00330 [Cocleimonas sp.]|nr:hypothetical protein [Cocleimonas sp.]
MKHLIHTPSLKNTVYTLVFLALSSVAIASHSNITPVLIIDQLDLPFCDLASLLEDGKTFASERHIDTVKPEGS